MPEREKGARGGAGQTTRMWSLDESEAGKWRNRRTEAHLRREWKQGWGEWVTGTGSANVSARLGQTGGQRVSRRVTSCCPLEPCDGTRMQIKVQITVRSETGESEVVEVTNLNRSTFRADALGLSLAEARSVLAGLQQALVERQAAERVVRARRCPLCGRQRACKGHHRIVFCTPFGKLTLDSPRLYRCGCESNTRASFSPLAERLLERRSPELTYLETKFAALVSYGLTLRVCHEPISLEMHDGARQQQASESDEVQPGQGGSPALCVVGGAPRGASDGLGVYIRARCTNIFRFRTAGLSRSPAQGRKRSSSPSGRPDLGLLVRPA